MPNTRLEDMENNLPEIEQQFIDNDKVKETMVNLYKNATEKEEVKNEIEKMNQQWQRLINGPEALRVIGTFGENFKQLGETTATADIFNMMLTTIHVLLREAGEQKDTALSNLLTDAFTLLSSSKMPEIINKIGGVIITAVNKQNAPQFVVRYWIEIMNLIQKDKDLNNKITMLVNNTIAIMHFLYNQNITRRNYKY